MCACIPHCGAMNIDHDLKSSVSLKHARFVDIDSTCNLDDDLFAKQMQ